MAEARGAVFSEVAADANDDLELEPGQDPQSLDLLNHPNYQERSRGNRRHRRRRTPEAPVSRRGVGRGDGASAPTALTPLPEPVIETPRENVPVPLKPSRSERPERVERSPMRERREKASQAEPEIIAVEMTPEEQELYAMMGLSPLLLANREIKDPKSVVISVVLPGESGSSESSDRPDTAASLFEGDEPEPEMALSVADRSPSLAAEEEVTPAKEPNLPILKNGSDTEQNGSGSGLRRRRRRRSSAASE